MTTTERYQLGPVCQRWLGSLDAGHGTRVDRSVSAPLTFVFSDFIGAAAPGSTRNLVRTAVATTVSGP